MSYRNFNLALILMLMALTSLSTVSYAADKNTLALVPLNLQGVSVPRQGQRERIEQPERIQVPAENSRRRAQTLYSIDFVSAGGTTAMDFSIQFPPGSVSQNSIAIGSCVADLPKSHMGQCKFNAESNELKVVIFSLGNAELPTGSIGHIRVPAGASPIIVQDSVTMSDADGSRQPAEIL